MDNGCDLLGQIDDAEMMQQDGMGGGYGDEEMLVNEAADYEVEDY